MSYLVSDSNPAATAYRGVLLGMVIALHAGLLFVVLGAKTVPPVLLDAPLLVQFIDLPNPDRPMAASRSLPVSPEKEITPPKPTSPSSRKTAAQASPLDRSQLETTNSREPAPASAPVEAALPLSAVSTNPMPAGAASGSSGGGDVSARFDADYLKNPAPPYPLQSRRLGEEGKVILRVFVTSAGSAQQVELRTSSGSNRLDESARKTVHQWKFVPAKRGGVAVESWVLVPIIFKLEE